jgi:hypothetical protein
MSATRRMWGGFIVFVVLLVAGVMLENAGPPWLPWAVIGAGWLFFIYAMYVFYFDVTKGDRHLQKRGIRGTAVVLSAVQTRTVAQTGQFTFQAPFIWTYRLRVTIPGQPPFEATCGVARDDISEGSTVPVSVSRFNHRSVAILAGQPD